MAYYGTPAGGNGQNYDNYAAPNYANPQQPAPYQTQPAGYQTQPAGYQTQPAAYQTQPAGYQSPPTTYGQPPTAAPYPASPNRYGNYPQQNYDSYAQYPQNPAGPANNWGQPAAPPYSGSGKTRCLLWVDDKPQNNTKLVQEAQQNGITVYTEISTALALDMLKVYENEIANNWDFRMITDMHRVENNVEVPNAGIRLIEAMAFRRPPYPILLYCGHKPNLDAWHSKFTDLRATTSEQEARNFVLFNRE